MMVFNTLKYVEVFKCEYLVLKKEEKFCSTQVV